MNKLQIIEETVKYYSEDVSRRAIKPGGRCEYLTSDGKMCAVGRCMINPGTNRDDDIGFIPSYSIIEVDQDKILKKEYRGHENEFWFDLQKLHDANSNWIDNGLSDAGQRYVEKLKEKWA